MKKSALIVKGGWDGHEPDQVGAVFEGMLTKPDFEYPFRIGTSLREFSLGQSLSLCCGSSSLTRSLPEPSGRTSLVSTGDGTTGFPW